MYSAHFLPGSCDRNPIGLKRKHRCIRIRQAQQGSPAIDQTTDSRSVLAEQLLSSWREVSVLKGSYSSLESSLRYTCGRQHIQFSWKPLQAPYKQIGQCELQ